MASTAEELSSQSAQLAEMVAFFVMEDGAQQHRLGSSQLSRTEPVQGYVEQSHLSMCLRRSKIQACIQQCDMMPVLLAQLFMNGGALLIGISL